VTGTLSAEVVQECVVTLEPVAAQVEEAVKIRFVSAPETAGRGENRADLMIDLEIEYDEEDPPEPMIGDVMELGDPLSQLLALCLDPYPQSPGAEAASRRLDAAANDESLAVEKDRENPFSVLAALKTETE
jgi:uncharacterized metal-binding protein YceD (DUF177 family)